jgi:hypothetical protein
LSGLGKILAENFDATAPLGAVASRQKKSASRVLLPRLARFVLRGWLDRDRMVFGACGPDDLIGGAEDSLGALFGIASALKPLPRRSQCEQFTSAERHQLIVALKVAFASKSQIEMIKPETKRIIISAIVEVLPLNPFRHSIVFLDNNEKSIGYRQSALRTDQRFAGFIHC